MAFFSAISSSIGKKILLFGLSHIDVLDKDPSDFVSVDVGKRTILEVRDVGLHIKKLIALLHLKLPPELRLSKAHADRFRATVVFDFGVPQIIIELEGLQIQAEIADSNEEGAPSVAHDTAGSRRQKPQQRAGSPHRQASFQSDDGSTSDTSSGIGSQQLPTVDDLANSFIREEPAEEIRELEEALNSQAESLHESVASSEDGEYDEGPGMGAGLGLPGVIRNLLNTALDRLKIVITQVDIRFDQHLSPEADNPSGENEHGLVTINFGFERISIDSLASPEPRVDVSSSKPPEASPQSPLGKRRLRIENICGRLISNSGSFASLSRVSRPPSPVDTRSDLSTSQRMNVDHSFRQSSPSPQEPLARSASEPVPPAPLDVVEESENIELRAPSPPSYHEEDPLADSALTTDDDRFADASPDNGSPLLQPTHGAQSRAVERNAFFDGNRHNHGLPHVHETHPSRNTMGESSILYDDDGFLDYAINNDLIDDQGALSGELPSDQTYDTWGHDGTYSEHSARSESFNTEDHVIPAEEYGPTSDFFNPTASILQSHSQANLEASRDNLEDALHHPVEQPPELNTAPNTSLPAEDLAESKIFTHDEAESMYLSAMSAPPGNDSRPQVPGGWESSSVSSQDTASEAASDAVPEAMTAASILQPTVDAEDGVKTPRPGSPQSAGGAHGKSPESSIRDSHSVPLNRTGTLGNRVAKLFFTVDEINVWFPLGLSEDSPKAEVIPTQLPEGRQVQFTSPPQDSIFQDMPGSFSFYAQSTAGKRRKSSSGAAERPHMAPKPEFSLRAPGSASSIRIEVGSVISHVDLSTSRMLLQMVNRLMQALTGDNSPESKEPGNQKEGPTGTSPNLNISVNHVGFAWLEQLTIDALTEDRQFQQSPRLEANPIDAIVRVGLSSIRLVTDDKNNGKLQIHKFVLSSLDHDIISFKKPKSSARHSVGASPDTLHNDVEIIMENFPARRVKILTRPVNFMFDIQKLDEALGSYGGFSGILELGSSINSNTSVQNASSPPVQRARVVHFGEAPPPPTPPNPISSLKVDIQVGDVFFTLKGRSCALRLQTSSIRMAIRQGNLRMKIFGIKLAGPYATISQDNVPLLVDIENTEVTFLFAPEEEDLTRLISMITPSKDAYENDEDILIDTLLRQRQKGSVIRVDVSRVSLHASDLEELQVLQALGAEMLKLSRVTKYLPDDDRPGILTLARLHNFEANVRVNERIGDIEVYCGDSQVAHVGLPPLLAVAVGDIEVNRGGENLISDVTRLPQHDKLPMLMARMIGDEIEPLIKAKLFNVAAEYRVSTLMSVFGISEDGTVDENAAGLASSIGTITGLASPKTLTRQTSATSCDSGANPKPFHVDLLLRNCAVGLNPRQVHSKGLFVMTDAHFNGTVTKSDEFSIGVELRKASIHAIDDVARLDEDVSPAPAPVSSVGNRQLHQLRQSGYVCLGSISAAKASVKIVGNGDDETQIVDVEFQNDLFVLESCADSTQTLIGILNGLQPPSPPSTAEQYRTVVPLQEMMASFTGDAFSEPQNMEGEEFMEDADQVSDEVPTNLEYVGSFYNPESVPTEEEMGDSLLGEDDLSSLAAQPTTRQRGEKALLESFQEQYEVTQGEEKFDFNENYFADSDSDIKGTARKWDSRKNQYHLSNEFKAPNAPLKVRVRDMNIVWNLFDGYDWPRTRQIISQAVDDVEARAEERRNQSRDEDEEDVFIEEDFLFNSVWIGVPIKDEKGTLARKINHAIDDAVSETGSYATSTASRATGATTRTRCGSTKQRRRRLKLERSKHRKITFDLSNVAMDLVVFPPGTGETQNSLNVRVHNFEIFDHVPSSTWRKFATALQHPSEREMDRPMINLELLTVRPVLDLPASELVLRVTVQPLRLHVDQDALDFITRFFEFKDDNAPGSDQKGEQPFLQRVEVNTVHLKLDYKPKKVDYAGLRSGHTTEFMNFFILDGADITLRRAILYGITSADKLHKTLNDVWMPDVKRNQLPGILAGLAPVRNLVNVTTGVRDLVVIPVQEYKKDGRIFRSLQKGATTFARNTTSEVFRLGAKIAIGTQNILEGAETFLNPDGSSSSQQQQAEWEDLGVESGEDEPRAISNYANQPIGVMAGLRGAARHLEKDLLTARDAIIAIPGEAMDSGSGVGAAKAIARRAPTVILKPTIGVTKAVSNALLGVGNALDKDSRRKIEDKYKSY